MASTAETGPSTRATWCVRPERQGLDRRQCGWVETRLLGTLRTFNQPVSQYYCNSEIIDNNDSMLPCIASSASVDTSYFHFRHIVVQE